MINKFPKAPDLNVSVSHREIPAAPGAGQAVAIAGPKAHGTILLVEDTHSLREVTKEFLELAGYTVLEASNGPDALALVQNTSQTIQLLLTDVIMPGMSGPDLAKNLQALYPNLHVLYMSGYTDNKVIRRGDVDPGSNLLNKPFTREKLTTKVREMMGS
ncbi:MAG TPA: response regulator [Candidatus Acidoferrum sp.]|nr:response regulator [Candidatus Acidoferrum sp.]